MQLFVGLSQHNAIDRGQTYTQSELSSLRADLDKAITNMDFAEVTDIAFKLKLHNQANGSNFDSIYHYNEVIISSGLKSKDYKHYVDAQKDNFFMDLRFAKGNTNLKDRVRDIRPVLDVERVSPAQLSDVHLITASYHHQQGNVDSTIYHQKLCIALADEVADGNSRQISTRLNIGKYLSHFGKTAEALSYLTEAEPLIEQTKFPPLRQISFLVDMTSVMLSLKDTSAAKLYIEKLEKIVNQHQYKSQLHYVPLYKGKLSVATGRDKDAVKYFEEALMLLGVSRNKKARLRIWQSLANSYFQVDDEVNIQIYIDSIASTQLAENSQYDLNRLQYFLALKKDRQSKAYELLQKINQYNQTTNPNTEEIARLNYLYEEKYGSATTQLQSLKTYQEIQKKSQSKAQAATAKRIESQYNREKQNLEISALSKTTAAQERAITIRNNAIWMGSAMLLILALVFYWLYKLYKENQKQTVLIRKALEDNQMLIKEIHHRVKNNLQVVTSLLSMQARKLDEGDVKEVLNSSKTRVQSMSILHQNLYSGTNPKDVEVSEYFDQLVENIFATYNVDKKIKLSVDIDPMAFDIDVMVPLGLIANELITNALKHAFIGKDSGLLSIALREKGDYIELLVRDDGHGFEGNTLPQKQGSIGTRLIHNFTKKLKGKINITHNIGTEIEIKFDKKAFQSAE